jgi:hypothetical protein
MTAFAPVLPLRLPLRSGRRQRRPPGRWPLLLALLAQALGGGALLAQPQTAQPQTGQPQTGQPQTGQPQAAPTQGEAPQAGRPKPYSSPEFQQILRQGSLEELALACQRVSDDDRLDRLRQLRERLLLIHPAPQPLPVVLANAEVLLRCQQPQAALTVLDRISPAAGAERVQWLLLQWRAAHAAIDHRRAALALERLAAARPAQLEALALPLARRADGSVVSRSALELLADHQQARGFPLAAAELLLASQDPGVEGAQRRLRAVRLLQALPPQEREGLLEQALDQAAAVGAWGLVAELLDAQVALPSERARQRRLRLSPRLDDAYGEWQMLRQDPAAAVRRAQLEAQLRSPRSPGGHSPPPAPPVQTLPSQLLPSESSPSKSSPAQSSPAQSSPFQSVPVQPPASKP